MPGCLWNNQQQGGAVAFSQTAASHLLLSFTVFARPRSASLSSANPVSLPSLPSIVPSSVSLSHNLHFISSFVSKSLLLFPFFFFFPLCLSPYPSHFLFRRYKPFKGKLQAALKKKKKPILTSWKWTWGMQSRAGHTHFDWETLSLVLSSPSLSQACFHCKDIFHLAASSSARWQQNKWGCEDNFISHEQICKTLYKHEIQMPQSQNHPSKPYCTHLTFSVKCLLINHHKEHLLVQHCVFIFFPADSQLRAVLTRQTGEGQAGWCISKCHNQVTLLFLPIAEIQHKPAPLSLWVTSCQWRNERWSNTRLLLVRFAIAT